jgi:dynein heavy chain
MGTHTKMHVLNPKVFNIHEIYGFYDSAADESKIGVFSYLMSELCSNEEIQSEFWIMFDGPIDTKWIESMNSLLDDNKVLTLLDGNRINLKSNVKIIFEVDELTQASPATVSRCGMLFVDARELSWRSVFTKWILEKDAVVIPDSLLDFLEDLSDKWIEPLLKLL